MSKRQTPIVQTYYEFSDVKHREVNTSLDYTDNVFMYLQSMRYAKGMQAISLKVLEQLIVMQTAVKKKTVVCLKDCIKTITTV